MLRISFACVKSRINKSGESPIQLWINCNGSRATTYLDLRVKPSIFQKSMKSRHQNPILQYCDSVRWRIISYYSSSICNGLNPTPRQIVDYVRNKYTEKQQMFYEFLDTFLNYQQSRENEISYSTHRKHHLVVQRLKESISDKPLRDVTHADILAFRHYLASTLGLSHNSLCGYLTKAKSIFNYALERNQIKENPFRNLPIRWQESDIHPLTKSELERIRNHDFGIARLNHVRDCFVFAANTAVSYSDLASICPGDIREQDGVFYIKKKRIKTGVNYIIPLNDIALDILRRYHYRLPVICIQKYNAYLKEVAAICGIQKRLTSHLARHTAATLMLNSGISLEIVSRILGHTNTRMTTRYAKLLDRTIIHTKINF